MLPLALLNSHIQDCVFVCVKNQLHRYLHCETSSYNSLLRKRIEIMTRMGHPRKSSMAEEWLYRA
jgi:hypothetical protein